MKQRFITSIFIVLATVLAVVSKLLPHNIGDYIFDIFILGVAIVAGFEICNMFEKNNKKVNKFMASMYGIFNYIILTLCLKGVEFYLILLIEVLSLAIYWLIILILEFFISSSTAKSIFVMGILSLVTVDLSKEMLVLIYLFGDGFTNVLLPTSPVLLIGLSMVGLNYFTWLKKSKFLFLINTLLVIGLILLAVLIGY